MSSYSHQTGGAPLFPIAKRVRTDRYYGPCRLWLDAKTKISCTVFPHRVKKRGGGVFGSDTHENSCTARYVRRVWSPNMPAGGVMRSNAAKCAEK